MITRERAIELFDYNPEIGTMVMRSGACGWYEDGYLRFALPNRSKVRAHQIAWLIVHGEWTPVDHKDGDRPNIKISNLRKATAAQNLMNAKLRSDSTTKIKGVSFCSATCKWRASIMIYGKSINLGRYKTKDEAALAYAEGARKHFGEFARLA